MIKKYNIAAWYLVTLIFTVVLLLPHLVWQSLGNYSVSLTQFGPLFATLLVIRFTQDESAKQAIKNGLLLSVQNTRWYLLSAFIPVAAVGVCALVLNEFTEYHSWGVTPLTCVLSIVAMFLGSIGEEIGWRGYLLPMLSKKASPFISSLITGLLWGFWHLNYAADITFWLLFIVTTIELSIILTFLINKTHGNLWTAIILHTLYNLSNRLFVWERINAPLLLVEIVVLGLTCAVVLVIDRKNMFKKDIATPRIRRTSDAD
jgi:membrane protease YdiL (CAAX protease family)